MKERHRGIFWEELQRRGRPRCRSYWLCAAGGLLLGAVTGLLGRKAIAATTVAVERVVLMHLDEQVRLLRGRDDAAVAAISKIVADEREHLSAFAKDADRPNAWTPLLTAIVSASTRTVIWLGLRL